MTLRLYSYWRSTTSYRTRIALAVKGVDYETVPVDLSAGAQSKAPFLAVNPSASVPVLELPDKTRLSQSMAILDYLEAAYPDPALLPKDPLAAAKVREAALIVACDIHPVNNLKVVTEMEAGGMPKDARPTWMLTWMRRGFDALSKRLSPGTPFAFGDTPGLADVCLIPQLYNAKRWGLALTPWPRLAELDAACLALPAFAAAHPDRQPDCPWHG